MDSSEHTILLADSSAADGDNSNQFHAIKDLKNLLTRPGWQVFYAGHREDLVASFQRSQPDLVVLDGKTLEYFAFAQKLAKLGYWEWDVVANLVKGSEAALQIFGLTPQSQLPLEQFLTNVFPADKTMLQREITAAMQGQSHIEVSFRVATQNVPLRYVECIGRAKYNQQGEIISISGSVQDITRLHRAESTIEYQAKYDVLTGIANRQYFETELAEHCERLPADQCSSVIVLDVDRFKAVNDGYGQQTGDQLLIFLATRLKQITRKGDFVARLGSDEFAIIVRTCKNPQELQLLINRLEKDLKKSFLINSHELYLTFSFGVATYPYDSKQADALLHKANIARGKAKRFGGNQAVFYQSKMNVEAKYRFMLENDLHRSIEQDQIKVFFQPQVDAKTLQPVGAEALVRWQHPNAGWVSPEVFVPLAESSGVIADIGMLVLAESIRQLQIWHQLGFDQMRVGVNLSPSQLTQPGLVEDIDQQIKASAIAPEFIDLEITESLAMADAQQTQGLLTKLKALGVALSIDDFGTGYSSLSYLHQFPIDNLKIDQSFIANLDTQAGETLVRTILAMAKGLGLSVVAEGIENPTQIEFLQQNNCDILQGFYFGKPMQSQEFVEYLQQNK